MTPNVVAEKLAWAKTRPAGQRRRALTNEWLSVKAVEHEKRLIAR